MANVYCVSYDLNADTADYSGLYEVLKDSIRWWHFLESTWLIVIDGSAADLWKTVKPHLKKNDRLLIIEAGRDSQGWLPEIAWDWIRRNIDGEDSDQPRLTPLEKLKGQIRQGEKV